VDRSIVGFHRDDESHWVAELDCGHDQHVRHDPPMVERLLASWAIYLHGKYHIGILVT
jgi:hypothetical protein